MNTVDKISPHELYRIHGDNTRWENPAYFVEIQPDGKWRAFESQNPKDYHRSISWQSEPLGTWGSAISTAIQYKRRKDQKARNAKKT